VTGSPTVTVLAGTFGLTLLAMLALWLVSLMRRDASIVDVFWGPGFALIAVTACLLGDGYAARARLVAALTVLWGFRLAAHLLWRNWGRPEDPRYAAMRRRYGDRFPLVSLYLVFGLQAALMWIVSLPVQIAAAAARPAHLTSLDRTGIVLWAIGLTFESVGDWQLARFKSDPRNRGKVMDRGLWRYTRHPNYFGDAVVWWALFCFAAATEDGAWTAVGPLVMTILLMRVSGVTLLEQSLVRSKPLYRDYMRRTSPFLPWFPRS
jgi:steroid 5-alpha reductase family enzyme